MEGRDRDVVHRWSRERWLTLSRANVPYAILSRGHEWYSYCVPGCRPKSNSIIIYRRRVLLFVENWFFFFCIYKKSKGQISANFLFEYCDYPLTWALHEASLPKLQVLGSMWNRARCYSADSFCVTVKQNGCFHKHSTPFVGICETYDDGGIQRESLTHVYPPCCYYRYKTHCCIMEVHQQHIPVYICRTSVRKKQTHLQFTWLIWRCKVAQSHCVCVSVWVWVCVCTYESSCAVEC